MVPCLTKMEHLSNELLFNYVFSYLGWNQFDRINFFIISIVYLYFFYLKLLYKNKETINITDFQTTFQLNAKITHLKQK